MPILMFLDDVLRSTATGAPIPQGVSLYRTLREKDRVLILCENKPRDDRWLKEHKINLVDDLIGRDIPFMTEFPEWRQIEFCRGQWSVDMVVTANPEVAEKVLSSGLTAMMFLHPIYIAEKFRPDGRQGVKAWDSIKNEIVRQQSSFLDDHRNPNLE